ncbi:FG-GAP repeat domain-containing protein [Streptomyces sp. NPDC049040]|uniref:FG-GAP repeat domain-containing protein n=1 Tax=Streptomyces sp. NPDC049040 TaxID=3365593 RepID=UPI003717DB9C
MNRRHRRLAAACTAGILSLGAFALGTGAQAAEPGPHQTVKRPTATSSRVPHLNLPKEAPAPSKLSTAQAKAPQRYDIDGDGVSDQLYRQDDGTLYNSTSTEEVELRPASERFVDLLTPGNLNATGEPEILATTSTGQLEMFTDDNFPVTPSWSGKGWNIYNKLVAVDDISGDGRADIVARDYNGGLYLYKGTGNGAAPFAARVSIGSGWGIYDQLTSPGDVSGDGISDLVARDASGVLWLYKGTGKATAPYAARTKVGSGWGAYNEIIGFGNENGRAHLWGRTADGTVYYYMSNGSGGFTARQSIGDGFNVDLIAGSGGIPFWGKKEMFGETSDGSLYWYGVDDAGQFAPRQPVGEPGGFAGDFSLIFANALSADGVPTILDRFQGGLYNLDLDRDPNPPISTGWGGYDIALGPGDLSGDGASDLLARNTAGNLYLYLGKGDGQNLSAPQLVGGGWNTYTAIVGSGDFSGDGRADIVARDGSGAMWLYKGTGNAAKPFATRIKVGTGWGGYTQLASPGDMDGDGRADLIAVDASGVAYRYSSTGTGTFKTRVKIGTGWSTYKKLY